MKFLIYQNYFIKTTWSDLVIFFLHFLDDGYANCLFDYRHCINFLSQLTDKQRNEIKRMLHYFASIQIAN